MLLISRTGAMPREVGLNFIGDSVQKSEVTEVEDVVFGATTEEQMEVEGEKGKRSQLRLPDLLNSDDILITQ